GAEMPVVAGRIAVCLVKSPGRVCVAPHEKLLISNQAISHVPCLYSATDTDIIRALRPQDGAPWNRNTRGRRSTDVAQNAAIPHCQTSASAHACRRAPGLLARWPGGG